MSAGVNPKDLIGMKKISFTKLPPVGLLHAARAMMDGARKYGPYNWREKPVQSDIYVDAAFRHLLLWFCRDENSDDAGVHHLGHVAACCMILMDAQANGSMADTRPKMPVGHERDAFIDLLASFVETSAVEDTPIEDLPLVRI